MLPYLLPLFLYKIHTMPCKNYKLEVRKWKS
jgi:hypothetical protein